MAAERFETRVSKDPERYRHARPCAERFVSPRAGAVNVRRQVRARLPWIAGLLLAAAAAAPAQEAPARHCLWRVQSGRGVLYLAGSLHALRKADYPLAPPLERAFEESEELVLEVDVAEMERPEGRALFSAKGALPEGCTLRGELSPETYAMASAAAEALGVRIEVFEHYKPWLFTVTMAALKLQSLGYDAEQGMDRHYHRRAVAAGKRVVGLETLAEQLALFDGLSATNQEQLVRQSIEEMAALDTEMAKLVAAWRGGDLATLERILMEGFAQRPDLRRVFVGERNRRWVARLKELLRRRRTCMVIVGAGHLPGEDGLLALLRAAGFAPEQL